MENLSFIPFLICLIVFAVPYLKGKEKFAPYVAALDKKVYGLKDFFPAGFMIMEWSGYDYSKAIDRQYRICLRELVAEEYVEFYLHVIWAQAVSNALIGLLMGTLFFGAMNGDVTMLIVGIGLGGVLAYTAFSDVKKQVEHRHNLVSMSLPDLTNQILILSGAGMTLRAALIKISKEMPLDGPLYETLGRVTEKMEYGATDEEALELFNTSCNIPQVRRFVSVLLQNMQRGGTDVLLALREIGKELWDNRRAAAKQIAEETTTKMLFPMVLMLLAVILLVAAPAVMGMGI